MYGIYIHIPFCIRKCPYCDFYSVSADEDLRRDYLSALKNQILSFDRVEADTVYFGGGTPSLLDPREIADIMALLRSQLDISSSAEVTMECNPATADT
ncbi:MAG: radical SAM protein, partial [Oscillospiraceae bacterium]|nr:radical SAM protein [Oscillospiraceae bacterium]